MQQEQRSDEPLDCAFQHMEAALRLLDDCGVLHAAAVLDHAIELLPPPTGAAKRVRLTLPPGA